MQITFAIFALLTVLTASWGAPVEEQGLAKRRIFNYEPDLPVGSIEEGGPRTEIRREHVEGRNFDIELKRHTESPDTEVRRHEEGLHVEVRRHEEGLHVEVRRHENGLHVEV